MNEPVMQFWAGEPIDATAIDAMAIHLAHGCVFQPVFQPVATEQRDDTTIITKVRLVAIQIVRPAAIPAFEAPVVKVPRGRVRSV